MSWRNVFSYLVYASISAPFLKLKTSRPSSCAVTVSITVSQSQSSNSMSGSSCSERLNMKAPILSAFASHSVFAFSNTSRRSVARLYRSTRDSYLALYSSWLSTVLEFSAMHLRVSSATTSISVRNSELYVSISEQS